VILRSFGDSPKLANGVERNEKRERAEAAPRTDIGSSGGGSPERSVGYGRFGPGEAYQPAIQPEGRHARTRNP
jgi:hypothetical protein